MCARQQRKEETVGDDMGKSQPGTLRKAFPAASPEGCPGSGRVFRLGRGRVLIPAL